MEEYAKLQSYEESERVHSNPRIKIRILFVDNYYGCIDQPKSDHHYNNYSIINCNICWIGEELWSLAAVVDIEAINEWG